MVSRERLTRAAHGTSEEEERREAAELLHALGTAEAAEVPVLRGPAPISVARELIALRLRRAARIVAARWAGASLGGGLAGALAGGLGGLMLAVAPGSAAPIDVAPVLAVIGGGCGALGGAGVGAGLCVVEASARSTRLLTLFSGAAPGGGLIGWAVQWIGRWSLAALVGLRLDIGGTLEGLVIGGAAGFGYGLATRHSGDGMAAPRGRQRPRVAAITARSAGWEGLC